MFTELRKNLFILVNYIWNKPTFITKGDETTIWFSNPIFGWLRPKDYAPNFRYFSEEFSITVPTNRFMALHISDIAILPIPIPNNQNAKTILFRVILQKKPIILLNSLKIKDIPSERMTKIFSKELRKAYHLVMLYKMYGNKGITIMQELEGKREKKDRYLEKDAHLNEIYMDRTPKPLDKSDWFIKMGKEIEDHLQ